MCEYYMIHRNEHAITSIDSKYFLFIPTSRVIKIVVSIGHNNRIWVRPAHDSRRHRQTDLFLDVIDRCGVLILTLFRSY